MPTVTLTPTACTESSGWKTLYYYLTTNSSYYPRRINFSYPANEELAGAGVNITRVTIHGYARNSSSVAKKLRWGFKPAASSGQSTWSTLNGSSVLAGAFTAVESSNGSTYINRSFTQSYSGTSVLARHIKTMFDAGNPIYLGVIQPTDGRSISVNTGLSYWKIDVEYELLGNIPSTDVSSARLGETAITTTLTKVIEGSTTTLRYSIGDMVFASSDIGTGSTHSFTPSTSLGSRFPDSLTGTLTITAETYLDGISYGTVSTSVTLTLPTDAAPECSVSLTRLWAEGVQPQSRINAYVQAQSGVQFTISGTGKYGASIAEYALSFDGQNYTGNVSIHPSITGSGSVPYTYTVVDSRGLITTHTGTIPVLAWSPPSIRSFQITRVTEEGIEAIDATYAKASVNAGASSLLVGDAQKNQLKFYIRYRQIAEGDTEPNVWIDCDVVTGSTVSGVFEGLLMQNGAYVGGGGVDNAGNALPFNDMYGYEFQLVVYDMYASSVAMDTMPTREQLWDIDEVTGKMGFGGDAPAASDELEYSFHGRVGVQGMRFGWHAGDSITIGTDQYFVSGITGTAKSIFTILQLGMPIYAGGATATGAVVYRGGSGYLNSMSYTTGIAIGASGYTFSIEIVNAKAGWVRLSCTKTSAFTNVTNNSPVTMMGAANNPLVITFTE